MSASINSSGAQPDKLSHYLLAQLRNLFPGDDQEVATLLPLVEQAHSQTQQTIAKLKEWRQRGFDHLVSWQYATFLYKLGRLGHERGLSTAATDRTFLLNKALNGVELHPQIRMPEFFFLSHTNSAVFARATYGEYAVFHQNITVGRKGDQRPVIESHLVMYPGSMIAGRCHVKSNTVLAPGVRLIDCDTPGNCYVFDSADGGVRFRAIDHVHAQRFFQYPDEDCSSRS
jgi:serine O-acetyltransferase